MKYIFFAASLLLAMISRAEITATLAELSRQFTNARDFSVYQDQAWFSAQSPLGDISVIVTVRKTGDQWGNPQIASFSGKYHDLEPFISADGKTLYFSSNRPKDNEDEGANYDIWKVVRKDTSSSWSEPQNLGENINSAGNEFYPSVAANGNMYFTANKSDSKGKDDIYFSEWKNGSYQKSYSLGSAINSDGDEYNSYIAKDGSYLIFGAYKRKDSHGSGDLYIARKDQHGNWQAAENMGDTINSDQMDYCPFVDENTDILYFTSRRKNYQQTEFSSIKKLAETLNSIENGMSRIYETKLNPAK